MPGRLTSSGNAARCVPGARQPSENSGHGPQGGSYLRAGRTERTGGGYSDAVTYAERLRPPILWWIVVVLLASTFVVAVAAFLPGAIVLASLAVAVAIVIGLMLAFTATVRVTPAGFGVARSSLEWAYVGAVTQLSKDEVRRRLGHDADPRAFVVYRSYADEAVEVAVDDPADPHPYWLVSTHDAGKLAKAIETARGAA
jgi:hypothetical protein